MNTSRQITETLTVERSGATYWAGKSYSLYVATGDVAAPRRFIGHLGYHGSDWLDSDDAVLSALHTADSEWATMVAPFAERISA